MDQSEIRAVLYRERWARDTCHWHRMRECYHPDSSMFHGKWLFHEIPKILIA